MNKFLLTLSLCLATVTAWAQSGSENRMTVHQKDGTVKVYDVAAVDSVTFGSIATEGTVALSVTAQSGALALVSVTLPEWCGKCDVAVIPDDGSVADQTSYIRRNRQHRITMSQTVTIGQLCPSAKYLLAALPYDKYGVPGTVTTLPLTIGSGDVTDLGEGANTYIVPQEGKYSFLPRHVRGDMITSIDKVDWIWATLPEDGGESQDLLSDIAYDSDGRVTFTATGKKGNAVLGAFDASGRVIWTWLIWCTDRPSTMRYENGSVFMDRFIGAVSATPTDGTDTWGLVWQWGRPTPFFGGYNENEWDEADAFYEARSWTVINPAYKFEWGIDKTAVSMSDAIAAPLTFYYEENSCDWHTPVDLTLWGETKTDYDPSPAGYRLPSTDDWAELEKGLYYVTRNKGFAYDYNGQQAWWPAQGSGREFNTGCNIIGNGKLHTWSATSAYVNDILYGMTNAPYGYRLIAESTTATVYPKAMANRSFAFCVRCVADK